MLCREIFTVCLEENPNILRAICGQKVGFLLLNLVAHKAATK